MVGALVVLLGISIYSALILGKKTDDLARHIENEDEAAPVLMVRFPDTVFRRGEGS